MSSNPARYMLFTTGGRRYAVNVDEVDEIAERLPEYPIPDAPRFLRGVVNIHGKLAAVLDLSMYLGTGPTRNGRNLLLLRLAGHGLALLVEQMERIFSSGDILESMAGTAEFEQKVLILPEGKTVVLAIEALGLSVEKAVIS